MGSAMHHCPSSEIPDKPNNWYYFRPKNGNLRYNGEKELINS
jgi:hypothetical protein